MYASGGGSVHGGASQTQLQQGRNTPPSLVPQTWETSNYEAFDLSAEPPGSPPKRGPESHGRFESLPPSNNTRNFVSDMAKAKARPRGESDLGRPATKLNTRVNGNGSNGHALFPTVHENGSIAPVSSRYGKPSCFVSMSPDISIQIAGRFFIRLLPADTVAAAVPPLLACF